MKSLLILGAMEMHVPLILRARELGIRTITCDYLPQNPGHKLADEAYYDSTTDLDAVLKLAKRLKVDGIMTYNSDPAAPTAAYVAEKLGLLGNPYIAVKTMSEKDLFRKFLMDNGLNYPRFGHFSNADEVVESLGEFSLPVIIKPVDSSGSKGCTVIYEAHQVKNAVESALQKSRCKRFIVEEYIEPIGKQLHGDGFVKNGKVVFLYLGDHHFDSSINNLVPYSTTFPTESPLETVEQCRRQIQEFITKVGFKNGGFNVELRISKKDHKPYIIDIGARNGGNFIPKVIQCGTGFNFMDRALEVALGDEIRTEQMTDKIADFVSHLILHSSRRGVLKDLEISPEIESRVIEKHIYNRPGDQIETFLGANAALGVLIMGYESRQVMDDIVERFGRGELYNVEISENQNVMNILHNSNRGGKSIM